MKRRTHLWAIGCALLLASMGAADEKAKTKKKKAEQTDLKLVTLKKALRNTLTQLKAKEALVTGSKKSLTESLQAYDRAYRQSTRAHLFMDAAKHYKTWTDMQLQMNAQRNSKYWIGVQCVPLTDSVRPFMDLAQGTGLRVQSVLDGSPAKVAGLKVNDVIYFAGDKPLKQIVDLSTAVDLKKGGDVPLKLLRKGKRVTVIVKPAQRKKLTRKHPEYTWMHQLVYPSWRRTYRGPLTHITYDWIRSNAIPKGVTVTLKSTGKGLQVIVSKDKKAWDLSSAPLSMVAAASSIVRRAGISVQSAYTKKWVEQWREAARKRRAAQAKKAVENDIRQIEQKIQELAKKVAELKAKAKKGK